MLQYWGCRVGALRCDPCKIKMLQYWGCRVGALRCDPGTDERTRPADRGGSPQIWAATRGQHSRSHRRYLAWGAGLQAETGLWGKHSLGRMSYWSINCFDLHTCIYISSSVFIGHSPVDRSYTCCLNFWLISHRSCSFVGSLGLNIMCAQHMSRRDLKALTDTALTTCTGRLFQALTTRIEKNFRFRMVVHLFFFSL